MEGLNRAYSEPRIGSYSGFYPAAEIPRRKAQAAVAFRGIVFCYLRFCGASRPTPPAIGVFGLGGFFPTLPPSLEKTGFKGDA